MIRQAVPADLEALLGLLASFSEEAGTNFGREHLLAGLEPMLNNQDLGLVFVSEIDRQRASWLRRHRLGLGD